MDLSGLGKKVDRVHLTASVFLVALIVFGLLVVGFYAAYLAEDPISYHHDDRTNICFASHKDGGLTTVPCEAVKRVIEK